MIASQNIVLFDDKNILTNVRKGRSMYIVESKHLIWKWAIAIANIAQLKLWV
jgi:hypothetical protein